MNFLYENAPVLCLVFFFFVFLKIIYSSYRPSVKKQLQEYAFIPLKEQENER